jgi:hypothetical protein
LAVLLVFGLGARAVAIFESFGDTDVERREVLERVLADAHLRRLAEVDRRMRRIARRGGGAS